MNTATKKPNIKLSPVTSSQIAASGYDPATKTMALQFKGKGSVYHYANVPATLYEEFLRSDSKGLFFGARIKNETAKFPFTKIMPDEMA